jgi:hypothetical protein
MQKIDWTKWSAIAEILSAIAIVVTLAYLAIQTQQNTTAIQASVRQAMLTDDWELIRAQIEYPILFISRAGEVEMSDEELVRLNSYLVGFVRTQENRWLQYQSGVIDERTWGTYAAAIPSIFSSDFVRSWFWNRAARGEFDEDFVAMLGEVLNQNPLRQLPSVREALGFDPL